MNSSILPDGRNSLLPATPFDGQEFIDGDRTRWIYSSKSKVWDRAGTVDTLPLATAISFGLLSASDKAFLDKIPNNNGGFGIIVDTKLLLKSPTNQDGLVVGDIKLLSDSIDITCVSPTNVKLTSKTATVTECSGGPVGTPGLQFKVNEKFLKTLIINIPGPIGPDGLKGEIGDVGEPGWSDGPRGMSGTIGNSVTKTAKLTGITYNDIDGLTDTAIVDMSMVNDCTLQTVTSKVVGEGPADAVIATSLQRILKYKIDDNIDLCKLSNLDNWMLSNPVNDNTTTNLTLLRLAKGSNNDNVPFNGYALSDLITDITSEYKIRLKKIDDKWSSETKKYIETIDSKARTIISNLANDLAMCEFSTPTTEYVVTLAPCGRLIPPEAPTPLPPDNPEPPPDPPSPAAVAAGKAGVFGVSNLKNGPTSSLVFGNRSWGPKK